jgi:hypothetical protein
MKETAAATKTLISGKRKRKTCNSRSKEPHVVSTIICCPGCCIIIVIYFIHLQISRPQQPESNATKQSQRRPQITRGSIPTTSQQQSYGLLLLALIILVLLMTAKTVNKRASFIDKHP